MIANTHGCQVRLSGENVRARGLVTEHAKSKDIVKEHAAFCDVEREVKHFQGTVLAYVTPVSLKWEQSCCKNCVL